MQLSILEENKATNQDFEWYPTTSEIIDAMFSHAMGRRPSGSLAMSMLDVGAGDGKVLSTCKAKAKSFNSHFVVDLFAIEKSSLLLDSLPDEVAIIGTDFWEQTLIDKPVDLVFSNPPYSEFISWSEKVIREASAPVAYLVIPQRWKDSTHIKQALDARSATAEVIGSFDFLSSEDRKARAKVDLVCIDFTSVKFRDHPHRADTPMVDSFDLWINQSFGLNSEQPVNKLSEFEKKRQQEEALKVALEKQLVPAKNLIEVLLELYNADMTKLLTTYKSVATLDPDLMRELDVSVKSVKASLKLRIKGLKDLYWKELFSRYGSIIDRLTSKSRRKMLESLHGKTSVDFTASNAYALTIWAIKNANKYFDKQLIETFDTMIEKANIINYKSNQRVFGQNTYRYSLNDLRANCGPVKLEYRIVLEYIGGISESTYSSEQRSGLRHSAADFIEDVMTVANNLGFACDDRLCSVRFESGKKQEFFYHDIKTGKDRVLMEVKAFKNGNLHIKFDQKFMLALNVEAGRLKGWIHNAQQAAEELDETIENIADCYKCNLQMIPNAAAEILCLTAH